jgi:hypothetical protein
MNLESVIVLSVVMLNVVAPSRIRFLLPLFEKKISQSFKTLICSQQLLFMG